MLLKIFTVYDSKIEAYLPPFHERGSGAAIRAFESAVHQDGHQFNRHPADYTLFEIGVFDDSTAGIEMHVAKIPLGNGIEFSEDQMEVPTLTEVTS